MTVLETLLRAVPAGWRVTDVYVGINWVLVPVKNADGKQQAGVASTPQQIAADSRFQAGHHALNDDIREFAWLLLSPDETTAAVGLAALNALHQPDESLLTSVDAADWLAAQCAGRSVAIFGRFPFIDAEIRPFAREVRVFEQEPQERESSIVDMAHILPRMDVVAITSSSIINHTVDLILPHTRPDSRVVLLGPSTPLTEKLFACGIDGLFGVRVASVSQVIDSVLAGSGFQKMHGLQRVSLFKKP